MRENTDKKSDEYSHFPIQDDGLRNLHHGPWLTDIGFSCLSKLFG